MGIGFILSYSFVLWLVSVQLALFELPEIVSGFFLPLVFLWILSTLILEPRINLIKFKTARQGYFYLAMAALLFVIPTGIAQQYLFKSTGKLTELENISSITEQQKTKYYNVDNYYPSLKDAGIYLMEEVSGRHNKYLDFSIFISVPLYDSVGESDQLSTTWMGLKYFKTIDMPQSDYEQAKAFEGFAAESMKDFRALKKPLYFERVHYTKNLPGFYHALETSPKYHFAYHTILTPQFEPFISRVEGDFKWTLLSIACVSMIWFLLVLFARLDDEKIKAFSQKSATKQTVRKLIEESWLQMFVPSQGYVVTPILMIINIVIFLLMNLSSTRSAHYFSILYPDPWQYLVNATSFLQGEYWNLLTSAFIHNGIYQFICCLFAIGSLGWFLESFLGKRLMLVAYFVGALSASLTTLYFSGAVSQGASGAIMGVYGVGLVLLFTCIVPSGYKTTQIALTVVMSVFFSFLTGLFPTMGYMAHIGGFLSGCLLGSLITLFGATSSSIIAFSSD